MAEFYDFIRRREMMSLPGPSGTADTQGEVSRAVNQSLEGSDISDSQATKFAFQTGEFVMSDDFLGELSDSIGSPKQGENKEQFVERCKATMFAILSKRLD
jgi:hypothetical protein